MRPRTLHQEEEFPMLPVSRSMQVWVGLVLGALLIATREYHFATLDLLPSASWSAFFLAGIFLSPIWVFPALFVAAALLDLWAVTWGGVSSFCISPAYALLIPAYGALWSAGRLYVAAYRPRWSNVAVLGAYLLVGAVVCDLLSSGGFYFLSGRFQHPALATFGARFVTYFPPYLESLLFYVGIAAGTHTAALVLSSSARRRAERQAK